MSYFGRNRTSETARAAWKGRVACEPPTAAAGVILPWQGRWLAEGQTEGFPAIVRVPPPSRAPRATPPLPGEVGWKPPLSVIPVKAGIQLSTGSAPEFLSVGCRPFSATFNAKEAPQRRLSTSAKFDVYERGMFRFMSDAIGFRNSRAAEGGYLFEFNFARRRRPDRPSDMPH